MSPGAKDVFSFGLSSRVFWIMFQRETLCVEGTPRTHWQINCENHVVDVISPEEPVMSFRLPAPGA